MKQGKKNNVQRLDYFQGESCSHNCQPFQHTEIEQNNLCQNLIPFGFYQESYPNIFYEYEDYPLQDYPLRVKRQKPLENKKKQRKKIAGNKFHKFQLNPEYESEMNFCQFQNLIKKRQIKKSKKSIEKKPANKFNQIKWRTCQYRLKNGAIEKFRKKFSTINFPAPESHFRNYFIQFLHFKEQLKSYHYNCQCYTYMDKVSLNLVKYYYLAEYFQDQANNDHILPRIEDFILDLLVILSGYKNEYADLLYTLFLYMRGLETQHVCNLNRWKKFSQLFKQQLFVNKSFYKSHHCNYRNYIVNENKLIQENTIELKKNMDKKWFKITNQEWFKTIDQEWFKTRDEQYIKGQKKVPQSLAGKKKFDKLMQREQIKYESRIKSNIGYFTLVVLFDKVKQNEKANSLIYADDIFNLLITYNMILC